jgi:hypothetical protein
MEENEMVNKLPPEAVYTLLTKLRKQAKYYAAMCDSDWDDGFAAGKRSAGEVVAKWIEKNGGEGTT